MTRFAFCLGLLLALGACAQTNVQTGSSAFGLGLARPHQVVVADFAFSSDVVVLDRGFTARLERKIGAIPTYERKQRTVERVNDEIVATIVSTLRAAGLEAQPGSEETLTIDQPTLVVSGRLRAVDQGNRTQRNAIGFGAGHSGVVADMAVAHYSSSGKKPILTFTAEAQSGRRPGAAATAPIAAARGAAAAANAAGGAMSERLSADVEAQARRLGRAAGDKIVAYAKEQGWLTKSETSKPEG